MTKDLLKTIAEFNLQLEAVLRKRAKRSQVLSAEQWRKEFGKGKEGL